MGKFKVTYATLSADNEELQSAYDAGLEQARSELGQTHPFYVDGEPREGSGTRDNISPADTRVVLGKFAQATEQDALDAVAAARAAQPEWEGIGWRKRVEILRKAADLISERGAYLSALLSTEVGKNRLEALGDVEESADLIRYYCDQMEKHDGYDQPMGQLSKNERTRDVLRPHGVWVVISPFNFPASLSGGPAGAALVSGNAVIMKPASDTPWIVLKLYEILREAGVPGGVIQYLSGPGGIVGNALTDHPDVGGVTFTGSYEVGFNLYRRFSRRWVRPCIVELGGKNPAIITPNADLERASTGVMRAAFGLQGQKCSACSRVYVHKDVKAAFTDKLLEKTRAIKVGDPTERDVFMGPVINEGAYNDFKAFAESADQDGVILFGGHALTNGDYKHGYFVEPTIVEGLPDDHQLMKQELFVPIVVLAEYEDLDAAMALANSSEYGLTAGFYSEDQAEVDYFLKHIEAGVVYINRAAGATTGAWPGVQPFGGWKGSGSTGKNGGGPYYLQQYMREQSQTIVE
jgi:1-pyrroline-5-carboxylate dehydrogenase